MLEVFSSRKILVSAVLLLAALGTVYFKGDIPPNLLSFLQVLFGFFVLGNAAEHYTNSKNGGQ